MIDGSSVSFQRLLFDYHGRLDRLTFWLGLAILNAMIYLPGFAGFGFVGDLLGPLRWSDAAHFGVFALMGSMAFYVFLTLWARRLQDLDKSAYWLAIYFGLWIVLHFGSNMMNYDLGIRSSIALEVLEFLLIGWCILEAGFRRGSRGTNRFGPPVELRLVRDQAAT